MRIPAKPPELTLEKLAAEIASASLGESAWVSLLAAIRNSTIQGKYLHWDKLRHLKPPEGLSHERWWRAIKFFRLSQAKAVPLKDLSGNQFIYVVPDAVHETLRHIDTNACGTIGSQTKIPGHAERKRYLVRSLIEEAISSSQLEGATTTRSVAKKMIRERRAPRNTSEQMILNNYATMERIRDLKDEPLSQDLVFELHRLITEDTLDHPDQAGRFRNASEPNWVEDAGDGERLHTPPPARELKRRMTRMCKFANGEEPDGYLHPVLRAIILHFWLAYDHPFVDGNGRCARALFYWLMLRSDYWLTEYLSISHYIKMSPSKYRLAYLHTETDGNDLTYFILWHLTIIERAINDFNLYINRKMEEIDQLQANLVLVRSLNYRQRDLISHALNHPGAEYTVKGHKNAHSVTRQTSRADLTALVEMGLLVGKKRGRTWWFYPAKDLADRLKRGSEAGE